MAKVVTSTAGAAAPEAAALMRRYGIALTSDNMAALAAYRARIRRARWWGVAGAAAAAAFGWLGSSGDAAGVGVARLVAGYLVGSVACELLTPQRRAVGAVHSASLVSREPELLLPLWARITPWLVLVQMLARPAGDGRRSPDRRYPHQGPDRLGHGHCPLVRLLGARGHCSASGDRTGALEARPTPAGWSPTAPGTAPARRNWTC